MKRLIFSSEQHRAFYEKNMARVRDDSYHKALFYLLGSVRTRARGSTDCLISRKIASAPKP